MRVRKSFAIVPIVAALSMVGCGGDDSSDNPTTAPVSTAAEATTTTEPASTTATGTTPSASAEADESTTTETATSKPSGPKCRTPDGTILGSLRFRLREGGGDGELVDGRYKMVRAKGINYLAAEVDGDGSQSVVLVSFPEAGQYLRGMEAVNGTARTRMPDLPEGPDTFPKGAQDALDCLDE